ncbi:expressed unknown protein [Seminavis robusta]|uniref:Uncharacterized protein n=1 Tax=Seminavis robusta TaxID=568900 RepID=A0A9N8DZ28_9STRA|nr:expressed unknown protein [Seminavis robusta]|eukprot:Sro382_g130950.1 n/a (643) ;mRNA; f:6091-8158
MKIFVATLFFVVALAEFAVGSDFKQFGNTIEPRVPADLNHDSSTTPFEFGKIVKLSGNGNIMAVGAPNDSGGAVFLYRRSSPSNAIELSAQSSWQLQYERAGKVGQEFGASIALSGDGNYLSMRYKGETAGTNVIETFSYLDNRIIGEKITTCDGVSLNSGATPETSSFGEAHWLLVGCENFDARRGKAQLWKLDEGSQTWELFTELTGAHESARFGFSAGFSVDGQPDEMLVAVSSPDWGENRGLAQVFSISADGSRHRLGKTLVGRVAGDQFGFAIDFALNKRYLVVGAPSCSEENRGCVYVFGYTGESPSEALEWHQVDETEFGENPGDRLGRTVAISNDGGRIAVGAVRYNRFSGLVKLFERDGLRSLIPVGRFEGEVAVDQFGNSVSMNSAGSMIVSGSHRSKNGGQNRMGQVRAFIDTSGFCARPVSLNVNAIFLSRPMCRDGADRIVDTVQGCTSILDRATGKSISQCGPSEAPSGSPSLAPSVSPSLEPSASPSLTPSDSPSLHPSDGPSESNSAFPPLVPPTSPSESPNAASSGTPTPREAPSAQTGSVRGSTPTQQGKTEESKQEAGNFPGGGINDAPEDTPNHNNREVRNLGDSVALAFSSVATNIAALCACLCLKKCCTNFHYDVEPQHD